MNRSERFVESLFMVFIASMLFFGDAETPATVFYLGQKFPLVYVLFLGVVIIVVFVFRFKTKDRTKGVN